MEDTSSTLALPQKECSPYVVWHIEVLTVQHWNNSLPQGEHEAQRRTEQEKVGHLKVKLPQRDPVQHGAAARPTGHGVAPQDTGM